MKFKKTLAGIGLALSAVLALSGCSSDAGGDQQVADNPTFAAGTTMEALAQKGTITVGTKFDQPLFGLADETGTPTGFDVEIAKIIAAELGIPADKIQWKETVSQNREPFIQDGTVDIVVATYTINDKRKEVIDFAGPYYEAGQSFLVPKGNPKNLTTNEAEMKTSLADMTICTVTGSTSEKNIREFTEKVITVDKYSDCLEPIRTGQADALTTDNVILAGLVSQNEGEFEVVEGTFTKEPYGIGLMKGDDEFRTFINDALDKAVKDGRWEQAWKSTVGDILPLPTPPALDRY